MQIARDSHRLMKRCARPRPGLRIRKFKIRVEHTNYLFEIASLRGRHGGSGGWNFYLSSSQSFLTQCKEEAWLVPYIMSWSMSDEHLTTMSCLNKSYEPRYLRWAYWISSKQARLDLGRSTDTAKDTARGNMLRKFLGPLDLAILFSLILLRPKAIDPALPSSLSPCSGDGCVDVWCGRSSGL